MNIIGFPRIGQKRELKKALESFWAKKSDKEELLKVAKELRELHWSYQKDLANVVVNDFSLYDNMLDLSCMLGVIPKRFSNLSGLELYFAMARGNGDSLACEMTKWFNTNYHYVVPELDYECDYKVDATKIGSWNSMKTWESRLANSLTSSIYAAFSFGRKSALIPESSLTFDSEM